MTTQKLLELTTEENLKELFESEKPSYEIYSQLKVLEKKLAQAEVLEKDINTQFLLSDRSILLSKVLFRYVRELP